MARPTVKRKSSPVLVPVRKSPAIEAPAHLAEATRQWWSQIVDSYTFEDFELRLLTAASEAWDRKESARSVIEKDGLTYKDRFGQPATRPEVSIERDSRLAFLRAMRELNLKAEPPDVRPTPLRYR